MAPDAFKQLSADHCVLLAVHYSSESNIDPLRILLRSRQDAFTAEKSLQILLTYLPETVDPVLYISLIDQNPELGREELPSVTLDTTYVKDFSDSKAHKLVKHLRLLPLDHASCPASLCDDLVARFLVHRAHRIAESGALTFLPPLIDPFLDDRPSLRTWFVSNVLPLLRFTYEYYTDEEASLSLQQLETGGGNETVDTLLSMALVEKASGESFLARDLKCLVGPWMYGANNRKRRKLTGRSQRQRRMSEYSGDSRKYGNELEDELSNDQKAADTQEQWNCAFTWITQQAAQHFPAVAEALDAWDGPSDVDLGGYDRNSFLDDDLQSNLEQRYAQTAIATVYAADTASREAVSHAHGVLVRIAQLMGFEPPPDLATSVEMLPGIEDRKAILQELTSHVLKPESLLDAKHPLTVPNTATFALLQLFIFSAYIFVELKHPLSIVTAARIRFQFDAEEQLSVVTRMLHGLTTTSKLDESQWSDARARLIWLWGWAIPRDEGEDRLGHGIFGNVKRGSLEKEILKAFLNSGFYKLVATTYIGTLDSTTTLTTKDVERNIVSTALHHYDNASNGNKTRGGVKKASEIITIFRKHFPNSDAFKRCEALLAATHSLSFYSLTLQHGVPFKPVNIRVSSDPVSLIEKVLAQNPRSYTKLDDLIFIATSLVASGIGREVEDGVPVRNLSSEELAKAKRQAERRTIGMAIEAALNEDDFETAYSYVINRLDTTAASPNSTAENDDISWRAALAAGRHKSSSLAASNSSLTPPKMRRLEQRMELLSQTLLLAPPNALAEVLNVWRKCEEEMLALQAQEAEEEEAHERGEGVPGAFINTTTSFVQPRREVGRGATEESPMGLFDVARGAAAAFSRNAFPLRGPAVNVVTSSNHTRNVSGADSDAGSIASIGSGQDRVRKRDMLSSAVTGGLASSIGWVIGAPPSK